MKTPFSLTQLSVAGYLATVLVIFWHALQFFDQAPNFTVVIFVTRLAVSLTIGFVLAAIVRIIYERRFQLRSLLQVTGVCSIVPTALMKVVSIGNNVSDGLLQMYIQ